MGHALQKIENCHTSVPQIFTSSLGLVPPPSPYDELIASAMDALLCNLPATGSEMHGNLLEHRQLKHLQRHLFGTVPDAVAAGNGFPAQSCSMPLPMDSVTFVLFPPLTCCST